MNHPLYRAMQAKNVTERDLATGCQVDIKTVSRWLSDEGRIPHPRHRLKVAELLGVAAETLWCRSPWDRDDRGRYENALGYSASAYIVGQQGTLAELCIADYTCDRLFSAVPGVTFVLSGHANQGCTVRIVTGDPEAQLTDLAAGAVEQQLPVPLPDRIRRNQQLLLGIGAGVEVRQSPLAWGFGYTRGDDTAAVTLTGAGFPGPTGGEIILTESNGKALFASTAEQFERLWQIAEPADQNRSAR
jgi:transcriptional regulator with XRE-family HTH domain